MECELGSTDLTERKGPKFEKLETCNLIERGLQNINENPIERDESSTTETHLADSKMSSSWEAYH